MSANKLLSSLEKEANVSSTYNGAKTNASTMSHCVDLFGSIGSMRSRSDSEIISAFVKAFAEDPLVALKTLFFARDVRGGLGERKGFRVIAQHLADNYTQILRKNLNLFPVYGRWDDLLDLRNTRLRKDVFEIIKLQFEDDLKTEKPSLLGKWLPSENTSSKSTREAAVDVRKQLGLTSEQYRKDLSSLRQKIKVVERDMCKNEWGAIDYESVPSRAAMIYRNAFMKHDAKRYEKYLEDVASGTKEIKSSTLYPYDIVRSFISTTTNWGGFRQDRNSDFKFVDAGKTLNLQWDALLNYVEPFNGLVVYDTSASMGDSGFYGGKSNHVRPIDVSLSLAIYIAERNTGVWKNTAIPFSSSAKFTKFTGNTIYEKLNTLDMTPYYGSTNLKSVFELILNTAVKNEVSEDDMPKVLFVISDMEFDNACSSNKRSNFGQIEKMYRKAGYTRPNIVFWNVNAYGGNTPITVDDSGACLVSGASPSILQSVLSGEVMTPVDVMLKTINSERYSEVII